MTGGWSDLAKELALWRSEGIPLPLWWRDDDAIEPTPMLDQLHDLARELHLPVHLAVIPKHATPALAAFARTAPNLVPLVHGWAHENQSPAGEKKAEFGTDRPGAEADLNDALKRLTNLFGNALLPVSVPPWNRVDPAVVSRLSGLGYVGLSTFTPRPARDVAGVVQINTHIDPINWRGGGGLRDADDILADLIQTLKDRRAGHTDRAEPLGFLSHHLVHDRAIWGFTKDCLSALLDGGATPCNLMTLKDNLP